MKNQMDDAKLADWRARAAVLAEKFRAVGLHPRADGGVELGGGVLVARAGEEPDTIDLYEGNEEYGRWGFTADELIAFADSIRLVAEAMGLALEPTAQAARRFERYRRQERLMESRRLQVYRPRRRWLDKSLRELFGLGGAATRRSK